MIEQIGSICGETYKMDPVTFSFYKLNDKLEWMPILFEVMFEEITREYKLKWRVFRDGPSQSYIFLSKKGNDYFYQIFYPTIELYLYQFNCRLNRELKEDYNFSAILQNTDTENVMPAFLKRLKRFDHAENPYKLRRQFEILLGARDIQYGSPHIEALRKEIHVRHSRWIDKFISETEQTWTGTNTMTQTFQSVSKSNTKRD